MDRTFESNVVETLEQTSADWMLQEPARILVVDDEPSARRTLEMILSRSGYEVETAGTGQAALKKVDEGPYNVVLLDIHLPDMEGVELLSPLAERYAEMARIIITGNASVRSATQALNRGASGYITKPLNMDQVLAAIREALEKQRLFAEKQQADAALRRYAEELETRNEELDAFAHTVAHDLKAPLHNIAGFADILLEDGDLFSKAERQESLETILQTADRMATIIDELLLLAEVRKGEVELKKVDMVSVVDAALERLHRMVEQHDAKVHMPDDWPDVVGYPGWIEEVWVNYLSNGLKYGGRPPHLELGFNADGDSVRFWVRDNGAGIPPDEQEQLFTPFTRLAQVRVEGHGLGLSVVRRIVRKLDGEVGVKSEVGNGSTFYFTLPKA